jgi:hypothetical protein
MVVMKDPPLVLCPFHVGNLSYSPKIDPSNTMLKEFDGHMFQPHGIITTFPIELGGKTIFVEVEVVDSPLEYNLLLGHTWFYEMMTFISSVFQVLHFPHQGNIITIDQLAFYTLNLRTNAGSNVPFVGDSKSDYMSVGVRMFK